MFGISPRRAVGFALAIGVASALATTTGAAATPSDKPALRGVPLTAQLQLQRQGEMPPSEQLSSYLSTFASPSFVAVSTDGAAITVAYVRGRSGADEVLRQVAQVRAHGVDVQLVQDRFTVDDLDAGIEWLNALPAADLSYFSEWVYELPSDVIHVRWTTQPPASVVAKITSHLGDMASIEQDTGSDMRIVRYAAGGRPPATAPALLLPQNVAVTSKRYNDSSPYYAGDPMYFRTSDAAAGVRPDCSAAFYDVGNSSGAQFLRSAGHCTVEPTYSSGNWYTGHTTQRLVGNTGTVYYRGTSGNWDFLSIKNSAGLPVVWGASDALYNVTAVNTPGVTSPPTTATIDGAVSGEHRNLDVVRNNFCATFQEPDGVFQTTCHLGELRAWDTSTCEYGDSGGPVFRHSPSNFNNVWAVGVIMGCADVFNNSRVYQYSLDDYQRESDILSKANAKLLVHP